MRQIYGLIAQHDNQMLWAVRGNDEDFFDVRGAAGAGHYYLEAAPLTGAASPNAGPYEIVEVSDEVGRIRND